MFTKRVLQALTDDEMLTFKPTAKVIWIGHYISSTHFVQSKKGNSREMISASFATRRQTHDLQFRKEQGVWLLDMLGKLRVDQPKIWTLQEVKENYEAAGLEDFELFWDNKPVSTMNKLGLFRL